MEPEGVWERKRGMDSKQTERWDRLEPFSTSLFSLLEYTIWIINRLPKSFERACSKLFINLVSVLQRIRINGPVFRALFIIILHACLRRHLSRLQILRHFSPIAIPTSSLSLGGLYSFAICMVPAISASYKFSRTCLGYWRPLNGSTNKQTNKWQPQQQQYSNLAILTS